MALANALVGNYPELAWKINPFLSQTGQKVLSKQLLSRSDQTDNSERLSFAHSLISLAPVDSRSYSQLGLALYLHNQPEEANRAVETALKFQRTDFLALRLSLSAALTRQDFEAAAQKIDILYRRWGLSSERFLPLVIQMTNNPNGRQSLLKEFLRSTIWQDKFVRDLIKESETSELAYPYVVAYAKQRAEQGKKPQDKTVVNALNSLIQFKKYKRALNLFQFTLSDEDRTLSTYTYDSNFTKAPENIPFKWQAFDTNASSLSHYAPDNNAMSQAGESESFLRINFLNKPLNWAGVMQLVYLPPARYSIAVRARGNQLEAPRGLSAMLVCLTTGRKLARFELPQENGVFSETTTSFDLPEGCDVGRLRIESTAPDKSFQNSYRGSLDIAKIAITWAGN